MAWDDMAIGIAHIQNRIVMSFQSSWVFRGPVYDPKAGDHANGAPCVLTRLASTDQHSFNTGVINGYITPSRMEAIGIV